MLESCYRESYRHVDAMLRDVPSKIVGVRREMAAVLARIIDRPHYPILLTFSRNEITLSIGESFHPSQIH
jgi:hypothetical protein